MAQECQKIKQQIEAAAKPKEREAFRVFADALKRYKQNEILLSFNGGKDCTVLLHLYKKFQEGICGTPSPIEAVYVSHDDAFQEVEEFVNSCVQIYDLQLIKRKGHVKHIFSEICAEMPHIKAVLMGTRRTDPQCGKLKTMQLTDGDWPRFTRISPLLDWKLSDIWKYISGYNVQYCSLYNQGYTSLGLKTNTNPNPHLAIVNKTTGDVISYKPASELLNDALERAGRIERHVSFQPADNENRPGRSSRRNE